MEIVMWAGPGYNKSKAGQTSQVGLKLQGNAQLEEALDTELGS
jgi:hypothetical protein